jgi:hypothetical protein
MARDKDDLLSRFRLREFALMALISVNAILANLPRAYVEETLGINYNYLIAGLACTVVVGLFLYLKFFYLIAVVLLIVGANMPDQIAEQLGISKLPLILALVLMVGISLINYMVKVMPTGLEPKPKEKSAEGIRAMFYGIGKNNLAYMKKVLAMNFDPNLRHENGHTPLAYAAMKGNPQMVDLLLRNGADVSLATADGDTPVELALRMGHAELANQLKQVRVEQAARAARHAVDVSTATQPG